MEVFSLKKALFLFNPNTGGNKLKNSFLEIIKTFSLDGYDVTVHATTGPGDAKKQAAKYGEDYDLLICCGGDGTLNETVSGLIQCKNQPLLGYIPGGTTNDFATSLGLPKANMLAAAKRIVEPNEIFHSDIGLFGGKVFNYVAAFGAFTDVAYSTNQAVKNTVGYFAYIFEAMGRLTRIPTIVASVECDGKMLDGTFIFGMITNSTSIGGIAFKQSQAVHMDDGVFEMVLVRQPRGLQEMRELSSALVLRDLASPAIEVMQGKRFRVISEAPITWTLDGEAGGETTDITIRVKHDAFTIAI